MTELASKLQHEASGPPFKASLDRLIAWGEMKWGCREKTMTEYLEVLVSAGFIEIERERDRIRWL